MMSCKFFFVVSKKKFTTTIITTANKLCVNDFDFDFDSMNGVEIYNTNNKNTHDFIRYFLNCC